MAERFLWITRARFAHLAWVVAIAAGCTDWLPTVGALQTECSYGTSDEYSTATYGSYGTGNGPCALVNAGESCDDCQSVNCCAPSRNCYRDQACKAADEALDTCIDDATSAATSDSVQPDIAQCRATFAASGQMAKEVITCEATCCSARCIALPVSP